MKPIEIVILVSGHGSNLQAIIDKAAHMPAKICAVISNCHEAHALERAKQANIPTHLITRKNHVDLSSWEQALQQCIDDYQPQWILLAGFMQKLSATFVQKYHPHILNVHPSLLPLHRGLHTHQQVLAQGDAQHGASVHIVTADLDAGPILAQAKLPVDPNETASQLKQRVQKLEHQLYPQVLTWIAQNRLEITSRHVLFDNEALAATGLLLEKQPPLGV